MRTEEEYEYTVVPVIFSDEEDMIHTDDHPQCDDASCPCHAEADHEEG